MATLSELSNQTRLSVKIWQLSHCCSLEPEQKKWSHALRREIDVVGVEVVETPGCPPRPKTSDLTTLPFRTTLGDIIHLFGFYPEGQSSASDNHRPHHRPQQQGPGFYQSKPSQQRPQPVTSRPLHNQWLDANTNLDGITPLRPVRPDHHFGIIDEQGNDLYDSHNNNNRPEQLPFSHPLLSDEGYSGESSPDYDNPKNIVQLSKGTKNVHLVQWHQSHQN